MKIKFDGNLTYQREAVEAVCGLFEGQEVCRSNFSVTRPRQRELYKDTGLGVGNKLELIEEEILENLQKVQLKNGLPQSPALDSMNFTVEMETGTGKTYVYLRTIFELNKRYGFSKFIIVVPSIAIKEGVYKSLQITSDHFKAEFENTPYDYFVYDSGKLGEVRNFAVNDQIQIMVINIDAFRKSFTDPTKENTANIIHRPNDKMNGNKPIEFIQATNPVLIIDEPQSVDNTPKAKDAIAGLNPLFTLRYSATHKEKHNYIYKLDPIDAYQKQLVKQIEVASLVSENHFNMPYVKLISVSNKNYTAKIELDVLSNGKVKRQSKTVKDGDDLFEVSGGREVYADMLIRDIYFAKGEEYIEIGDHFISKGEAINDADQDQMKRLQIRKTIEAHLDKELRLTRKEIKVLSLFFIDRVANYRTYDEEGNKQPGKYAQWFEEEYKRLIRVPKYRTLFNDVDIDTLTEQVHNGYFSADKTGKKQGQFKDTSGTTTVDEDTYSLIMKDKEKLLSFDSKLKFIFSHSALREGWDNPNVFQICTLNESTSPIRKRQEIGRGLRIAVNQNGERVHGFDVNTLTVMANESYDDFCATLQKEIQEDEGIQFGVVEDHLFANINIGTEHDPQYLGAEKSKALFTHLKDKGYIDAKGKIQDSLKKALKENTLEVPESFAEYKARIGSVLLRIAGDLNIKNRDDQAPVKVIDEEGKGINSEEFFDIWNRIKHKTTYRVSFDVEDLIEQCAKTINEKVNIGKAKYEFRKAKAEIDEGGVRADKKTIRTKQEEAVQMDVQLPDLLTYLQNETNLTRRTLYQIIVKSDKLLSFKYNPQRFLEEVTKIIKMKMSHFIVDGIVYHKIAGQEYGVQELFKDDEFLGYLSKNMMECAKSVFDHVIYDSEIEREFALAMEQSEEVKLYVKLPSKFKIDTPLGSYNPDWAVLIESDDQEKLYFVVETKGTLFEEDLRDTEKNKIKCGQAHFEALETDVELHHSNNFTNFMAKV